MDSILRTFFDYTAITSLQTLIPVLIMGIAIPYAVLRIRDAQAADQDPTIGLKCALFFPFSIGILLFLLGASHLASDLVSDPPANIVDRLSLGLPIGNEAAAATPGFETFDRQTRVNREAYGMMAGGIVVAFVHLLFLWAMTNNSKYPDTCRVFVGIRLLIHMIVVVAVLLTLTSKVFEPTPDTNDMKPYFGILAVWGPSWLLHLILLRSYRGAGSKVSPKDDD